LCEDTKQLEEEIACDAHEVESEAATKQIQLLQSMLQQASNELADLQDKSAQLQSEHESRVNAAAAASAAVERASKEPRMARYAVWLQQVRRAFPSPPSHLTCPAGATRFRQVHWR
jgi:septal ring factor EnvC (AmiA/AmiB activator)